MTDTKEKLEEFRQTLSGVTGDQDLQKYQAQQARDAAYWNMRDTSVSHVTLPQDTRELEKQVQKAMEKQNQERRRALTRAEVTKYKDLIFEGGPYTEIIWNRPVRLAITDLFPGSNVVARVYADKTEPNTLLELHYYGWDLSSLEHYLVGSNAPLVCSLARGGKASEDAVAILGAYDSLELNANELPGYVTDWLRKSPPETIRDLFEPVPLGTDLQYAPNNSVGGNLILTGGTGGTSAPSGNWTVLSADAATTLTGDSTAYKKGSG